jgi:hypothetical protein
VLLILTETILGEDSFSGQVRRLQNQTEVRNQIGSGVVSLAVSSGKKPERFPGRFFREETGKYDVAERELLFRS